MTLIVGILSKEGIVIGSDSQTTIGEVLKRTNSTKPKLISINEYIVFGGAGHVSFLQESEEAIGSLLPPGSKICLQILKPKIEAAIYQIGKKHVQKHNEMHGHLHNMPNANFILGSCIKSASLLYHFTYDGSYERVDDYVAIGSGMPYAEVLLKDSYRSSMNLEDAKRVVYSVIKETADVDNFVGGEIHIKIIKKDGSIKTIKEGDGEFKALDESFRVRKDISQRLQDDWDEVVDKILNILDESQKHKKEKMLKPPLEEDLEPAEGEKHKKEKMLKPPLEEDLEPAEGEKYKKDEEND